MAEEESMETSEEERAELFRYLQGEVTFEQYQAWKDLNRSSQGLVIKRHQHDSTSFFSTDGYSGDNAEPNTLSVSQVWDYLESNDKEDDSGSDIETGWTDSTSILDLPTTSSRAAAALSSIQANADVTSALNVRPEILAEYLTGKIDFTEFSKYMNEAKEETVRRSLRKRKKKVVELEKEYDDEEEEEEEERDDDDDDDETWEPDKGDSLKEKEPKKKKPRKRRRRMNELPKHLQGLMGEANLKFARGEHQEAIKMCMEIIRMAPKAFLPFHTIGMIYEDLGDITRATEFFLLSVHLRADDPDEWMRVADMLLDQNETKKAIHCYSQAIKYATTNKMELMMQRCSLYEQLGEKNKALQGYTQILRAMSQDPSMDEKYLTLARNLCKTYHEEKKTKEAIQILKSMFQNRPLLVNAEDVNMLLELHLSLKQYQTCLEEMVNYCGLEAVLNDGEHWTQNSPLSPDTSLNEGSNIISSMRVPDILPVDLRAKLCVCLINLGFSNLAKEHVEILLHESVEEIGDLFFEVAEAYMETSQCQTALPILQTLVDSKSFSEAGVWLRYADCLSSLGHLEPAVQAFTKVVELAPSHLEARVSLSALQQQTGKHDEAIRVLTTDSGDDSGGQTAADKTLLLHKCHLLLSHGRYREFVTASRRLLFHHYQGINKQEYMRYVLHCRSVRHRLESVRRYLSQTDKSGSADPKQEESKISNDDLWNLYLKMCHVLLELGKTKELIEVTMLGLVCPTFLTDEDRAKETEFMTLVACMLDQNASFAYPIIRDLCLKENNTAVWNLFMQLMQYSTDLRHHKFCLRYLYRHPDHIPVGLINGHNSLQNGTYKHALGEYVAVFRQIPADPLVSLCIGLCYVHMCSQKFTSHKNWLLAQGIAFLNTYLELRGECQEAYYNLGRAMHQLALKYAAVFYYKKALNLPPVVDDNDTYDLRREIAHNLSLLYQASGSTDLARHYVEKYFVV